MPFDNNLTLIDGVALTTTLDGAPTSTSYPTAPSALTRARCIDLGAPIISGSPGGTGVNGISCALVCTTSSGAATLSVHRMEACATVNGTYITIGTWETSSAIAASATPFHYVIRVQTELRFIRAHLTTSTSTAWTLIWVVVGTHHLERL